MRKILEEIVNKNPVSINNSVDTKKLYRYAKKIPYDDVEKMGWTNIEQLYVVGFEQSREMETHGNEGPKPGCYVNPERTWLLMYGECLPRIQRAISQCSKNLQLLDIAYLDIEEIDVAHLVGLHTLDLSQNRYLSQVNGLFRLHRLEDLCLYHTQIGPTLEVSQLRNLKRLSAWGNEKLLNVDGLSVLSDLLVLSLGETSVGPVLNVSALENLELLVLSNTKKLFRVEGLEKLQKVKELLLNGTMIKHVPEGIRNMKSLERLDLSDLEMTDLPDWLPELEMEFHIDDRFSGIILEGTRVDGVDMSIFSQSHKMIEQWFAERKNGNEVPLNEIKVVFLGNGEVGKSHTIARLLNDGDEPDELFSGSTTPGIAISNKEYDLDGQRVQVHFWDFGGQDILYSMHRMFMTRRTLYVILVDARNESKGNQAREWLDTVKSFAGDASILLVVNKIDENPSASIDEESLKRKYSNLKKVVYMSALTDTKEEFNFKFTKSMLELIRESGALEIKWPRKWTQVKAGLQNMRTPYIFSDAYEKLCQKCDVNQNQSNLLEWFNDLGISFCQFRDYNLKDYVILRPDWMTNAIYTILFNKREEVENGMISLEEISNLLNPTPENIGESRRVISDARYNWQETNYVLDVVRKFRLSYSVNKNMEFFPMLCKENSKPVAQEYADAPDTLEFQMKFEYLPNNVLHRLMVERWPELDTNNIWLTGARFVQPNTGLSAVVRIDGNTLQIYVRSENDLHSRNTYLSVIEGSINQIHRELKLPQPNNILVYKFDNRRAEFKYERLLMMYANGIEKEYSDELNRTISIRDILNQLAPAEVTEQEQLVADIVKACGQLQADEHYWRAKENSRNTYIRNALDNMRYIVRDQTLCGISGGESEAGELDLDIRKYPDVPWTICEALRVDSGSKTDWNFHLKKLLDNYNPNGVRFLVLLTYVDDEKDKFDQIWNTFKNHIQGHGEGGFAYQLDSFKHYQTEPWTGNHYIQTALCRYILGEYIPTVYHVFVRMGR